MPESKRATTISLRRALAARCDLETKPVRRAFAVLTGAAIAALFVHDASLLTERPCLGVADNQNFVRVTRPAGIRHPRPVEPLGTYVRCQFGTGRSDLWSAPSSAAFLAWCARSLRFLGPAKAGELDLRQIGLLHLALVVVIVVAGIAARMRAWLALLLLFVVSDPGYLLFFNSFYADGALIVALLGTVVWLERFGRLPREILGAGRLSFLLALAALGFLMLLGGGSKMLFVPLPAVVLIALATLLPSRFPLAPRRIATLTLTLVALGGVTFWTFFYGPGPRFPERNNFNAVYGGILSVATKPEAILGRLGVPREYWGIARTDAWQAGIDIDHPVHDSLRGVSRVELLGFYLSDPPALRAAVKAVDGYLLLEATHPRGNYPPAEGDLVPTKRIYRERWSFSTVTRAALAGRPLLLGLLLAAATAWLVAAALRGRWTGIRGAMFFLLLWFLSQAVLSILGEGFVNLHQHLVGARLGLDLLVTLFVADLGTSLALHRRGSARDSELSEKLGRSEARKSATPAAFGA